MLTLVNAVLLVVFVLKCRTQGMVCYVTCLVFEYTSIPSRQHNILP